MRVCPTVSTCPIDGPTRGMLARAPFCMELRWPKRLGAVEVYGFRSAAACVRYLGPQFARVACAASVWRFENGRWSLFGIKPLGGVNVRWCGGGQIVGRDLLSAADVRLCVSREANKATGPGGGE